MTTPDSPATIRTYGGRSADERNADRRRRLLDAALELFGTEGYAAVTVERVCTTAKVSTRHYYQLYRNKEEALLDLYASITAEAFAAAQASLEAAAGQHFHDRVTSAVRAYLTPILADPLTVRVAFVEVVGVSPQVEDRRLQFRSGIVALFEDEGAAAVERGEIGPRDFRFLALAFIGAINVIVHEWGRDPDRMDASLLDEKVCRLAIDIIEGAHPPN